MMQATERRQLDVFTKVCRNCFYAAGRPGAKRDPYREAPGGFGVTAVPILQRAGFQTHVHGRYTADDEPARDYLLSEGAHWHMQRVEGQGAVNAVLDEDG